MKLILESNNGLSTTRLPQKVEGNYWLLDGLNNLLNVESVDNKWIVRSTAEVKLCKNFEIDKISNINYFDFVELQENDIYYIVDISEEKKYILYCLPTYQYMENFVVDFNQVNILTFGKDGCDINIENELFESKEFSIKLSDNNYLLNRLNNKNRLFINGKVFNEGHLSNGDILFISGIYIYFFGSLILVSSNYNLVFNSLKINKRLIKESQLIDYSSYSDKDVKVYDKDVYFVRPPRFKRQIENKIFQIDAPTQKEKQEELPLIFTIAPMLTMGMTSLVTGVTALQKVLEGDSTLKEEFSSLLMCGCMMLAMIVFPLAQKFYTKIKKHQKERKRRRKYKKYIDKKREEIFAEINYQKQVLIEDNLPIEKVRDIILSRSRNLWERKLEHSDFLDLRLGIGTKKPDIDIKYPEEHFTLEEDDLKDIITDLVNESKDIVDVPITLNFRENNKVGVIGNRNVLDKFLDNLMLQVMAYHGYDMLRMIILTNESNKNYWEKYKNLTYLWNNDKSLRYYATNKDEVNKITGYLREEYNYRLEMSDKNDMSFIPYYFIIIDDINVLKNNNFIKDILELKNNIGYSLLMCVDNLDALPNECSKFINVNENDAGIFSNNMTQDGQISFVPDFVHFSLINSITAVSNIPVDINSGKFVLPKKYGFLEMYDVGNVNQLNIINRWKNNDIINSLSCPVGIDEQEELFNIDLHEKAHGPHGLVAGMTGSGKSEWIITYILSMAINYNPEEVQFVLIDYKGGGLTLTFDNQENGIKLPHVVGTITNLDANEIKRNLASIESELKRRQSMFKIAREQLNESSMDIYKYQEYYRAGKLKEPMSHLFIISDEFAELKAQQPDFMEQLISTARIGRSLGVHLILATQKPSGVVDDQIWSNSKFKVCLKVQDKSDSNDMIKMPDAAMLKETGRFYFQVGYNEFFAKGQSAYAGVPYYESDKKVSLVDADIDFVDDIGTIIKKGNVEKTNTKFVHKGEELPNILNYIIETSNTQNFNIKPLWLSRIPNEIYVDKLKEKYKFIKEDCVLNPIIGEYDEPNKQKQGLLTLPISKDGNVLIYGASGSGKELLLTTILYSLITNYSIYEVNAYILDFGSEILNSFADAPHVGDVVTSGNDEKIENMFKYINGEIKKRKKMFMSYNGNYTDYVKSTSDKIPNIIIIINQFEVFSDLYDKYTDSIVDLSRDANRYGIYFILTSSTLNGVKTKVSQNFKSILTLQLNDEVDYRTLLGNTNGVIPSKTMGRGLMKLNNVVEFQTAYAYEKEKLYKNIKSLCINLFMKYKAKAKVIPVLPEFVSFKDINKNNITIDNIPVGLKKNDLNVANLKLKETVSYLISCRYFDDMIPFIDKMLYTINNKEKNLNVFVFDAMFLYEQFKYTNLAYTTENYGLFLEKINDYGTKVINIFKENNGNKKSIKNCQDVLCVVLGLNKFINALGDDNKKMFETIINNSKETLKIHFIFVDVANSLKKFEYESWFKDSVDSSCGLWIGDGFAEQYSIKPTKLIQAYYDLIGLKFGYIVSNGSVEYVKLIEKE